MTTHHSRKQENGLQGCKDRLGLNPRLSDYRWLIDQVERLTKNLAGLQELADEHAWTENNPSRYAKVVEDRDIWVSNAKAWDKARMKAEKERDGFRDANDFLGNGFKRVVKERDEAIARLKDAEKVVAAGRKLMFVAERTHGGVSGKIINAEEYRKTLKAYDKAREGR